MLSGKELEVAALVFALLILLQLWIELRQIRRTARGVDSEAFLQVQIQRDHQEKSSLSFGGKQPTPGDGDELEQPPDRPSGGL